MVPRLHTSKRLVRVQLSLVDWLFLLTTFQLLAIGVKPCGTVSFTATPAAGVSSELLETINEYVPVSPPVYLVLSTDFLMLTSGVD